MIELVRDQKRVLAKFKNDPWKILDVRVLTGFVCPAARPLGRRQYPGALKPCVVKKSHHKFKKIGIFVWKSVKTFRLNENVHVFWDIEYTHINMCCFHLKNVICISNYLKKHFWNT